MLVGTNITELFSVGKLFFVRITEVASITQQMPFPALMAEPVALHIKEMTLPSELGT